ncbi:hypothetical protein THAOC_29622, partial [Thalassiosira oceanica]
MNHQLSAKMVVQSELNSSTEQFDPIILATVSITVFPRDSGRAQKVGHRRLPGGRRPAMVNRADPKGDRERTTHLRASTRRNASIPRRSNEKGGAGTSQDNRVGRNLERSARYSIYRMPCDTAKPRSSHPSIRHRGPRPPEAATSQMGSVLPRLIVAMAQCPDDAVIFFSKFDIQDGFWRMINEVGKEYNFAFVMPTTDDEPLQIVVPSSLQMGWVNSPNFFSGASETARDVADDYAEAPIGALPEHHLEKGTAPSKEEM